MKYSKKKQLKNSDFLNPEYITCSPKEIKKIKRENRVLNALNVFNIALITLTGLRNFGVLPQVKFKGNTHEDIVKNLEILDLDDRMFAKSNLNNEILISQKSNLKVGIEPKLDDFHKTALKKAINYLNYVLNGLNKNYSITYAKDNFEYKFCDIVVSDYDLITSTVEGITNLFGNNFDKDDSAMFVNHNKGIINNNAVYKARINVNENYWNDIFNGDKNIAMNYLSSVYLHELCHAVLGFDDVSIKTDTIMDYKDNGLYTRMYYYDLINTACAICDLTDIEKRNKAYNFITSELNEQLKIKMGTSSYRDMIQKKIAELQTDVTLSLN